MQNAAGLEHLVCLRQALVRHTSVAVLSVGNEAALCVRGRLSLPLSLCLARSLALSLARSFSLSLRLGIEEWLRTGASPLGRVRQVGALMSS